MLATLVLAGYVVLDGFDLGAGIAQTFVARTEDERSQILHSIAPVWDGNEVWLVALGGVFFLAFPGAYASLFSGFYLALMVALWLLMLRGISIEFRNQIESTPWRQFWSTVFAGASGLLALVFGVALANVVRGVPFDETGSFFLPLWTTFSPFGEVGIFDWYTLLVGGTAVLMLAVHGSLWLALKLDGDLRERMRQFAALCWKLLLPCVLASSVATFAVQPNVGQQLRSSPWGAGFAAFSAAAIVAERFLSYRKCDWRAFLASGASIIGALSAAAFGVFPNVLPSTKAPNFALTIYNASAGEKGLALALFWFIPGIALAIGYSAFVYCRFAGAATSLRNTEQPH
jgi:cytochrome d ubiquinol oxidase subunit II